MREFTGGAFIEFSTEEEAQRCTTLPIKVGGVNLEVRGNFTAQSSKTLQIALNFWGMPNLIGFVPLLTDMYETRLEKG